MVESVHGALGASSVGPSTCKSLLWVLSGASEGGLTASETRGVGSDEGGTLGVSLRSTRGPTSGWVLALRAGVFFGEDLAGAALAGLDAVLVSVVFSLAGLLCAVL